MNRKARLIDGSYIDFNIEDCTPTEGGKTILVKDRDHEGRARHVFEVYVDKILWIRTSLTEEHKNIES